MSNNLLIVESPAKAKTIEKYLGKEFVVKSSYGHIRDLAKGDDGVDVKNDFAPKYVVPPEKKKVVKALKDAVKNASEVWLATDEDREGEAISWHLCKVLGLDELETKRIVFREITKPAVQSAMQTPRKVDLNLVNAQQARRVLDRLVGFELSELLWRKVRPKLSAGRVQSVAVKLIVEREREIQAYESTPYFKIVAVFTVVDQRGVQTELKAELKDRLSSYEEAMAFVSSCQNARFVIERIQVKPSYRNPAPPFTTSTLQQEASRKLGFSVNRTMSVAQKLYEQGMITYMRTDSTILSNMAINTIAETIKTNFGEEYSKIRKFKSKSANAQEAHEAIRPTYVDRRTISSNRDMERLYDLIWKRTVASQMERAILEKTTVDIGISSQPERKLQAIGEVLKFDGFLKLYMASEDDDEGEEETKGILPPLNKGQVLPMKVMNATERFTFPPPRYTEASLVKKLEELGIGRPSTYAPTITKIMEEARGYVTKESRPGKSRDYKVVTLEDGKIEEKTLTEITGATTNRLYPSDMGMLVTDFLSNNFDQIMNYHFTAGIEEEFDAIAMGRRQWNVMLDEFYHPFHEDVEETLEKKGRARGKRELGKDPETGHTVLVQMTRYGPVVQIGTKEEVGEGKPKFANLPHGQSLENIEFDDAMKLFKLPRSLGEFEGQELIVNNGRYGPYIKFGEQFVSIPRTSDPFQVTKGEAIAWIEEKRKENAPIGEFQGKPISKGKGRYGPFIKWNDMYINVPRKIDLENISMETAHELIQKKINREANRYIKKWEEDQIAIENGRWGPFLRFKKKAVKLPKKEGNKYTQEELAALSLEDVKKMIEAEIPNAFKK